MRRTLTTLLMGLFLLGLVAAAQAQQSETEILRNTVKQLQDQLKTVMDRLQQIEARQAKPATTVPPNTVPAGPTKAPTTSWADKIVISGYMQSQYIQRANADDDFQMRRMYLNIAANVSPRASGVVQFERLTKVSEIDEVGITLASCFLDYKIDDTYDIMMGQVPTYFGWDEAESSSRRLPLERFAADEGWGPREGRPAVLGFWFGGPWDRGFYITRKATKGMPTIIAGLTNGNFRTNDNNQNKPYEVDLKWKRGLNQFGVSWFDGTYTKAGVTTERHAYDLYYHRDPCPWGFQAEYLDGCLFDKQIDGWYGQVDYNHGGKGTPYVRYEEYDQNKESCTPDTFIGFHAGYQYQLDKNNKLTLQLSQQGIGTTNENYSGFQWQLGF